MDEELLVFDARNALMEDLLAEDVQTENYPGDDSTRSQTGHQNQYPQNAYSTSRETSVMDKRGLYFVQDGVPYAEHDHERYLSSFERSVGVVTMRRDTAERVAFHSTLSFDDPTVDVMPKSLPQQSVQMAQAADEAPQLTYEGEVGGAMEQREGDFNERVSFRCFAVRRVFASRSMPYGPGYVLDSPSDEQLDSACPVLVNERQQAPYAIEEAEVVANDDSQPSTSNADGTWTGANPLRRFSVLIGSKKLTFKLIDAPQNGDEGTSSVDEYGNSDEQRGKCFVCGRTFAGRAALREHQLQHTNAKPNVCSYCGRRFIHRQSLTMHERMHTGEKPFQCPICTKCFARQTNYNIHLKLHASGRRYFCSFCGKWYRTEHEMLDHQQQCLAQMHGAVIHTDRPLRYQCSYCEKMFHHRRDKNIHERTHTGERPYSCGYCGKGFTQSQALTIHIRTHTGERPYTCNICAKDFRDSSALRKHEFMKHISTGAPISYQGLDELVLMSIPSTMGSEQLQQMPSSFQ
ncbi:Zinc finger protein [Toxocara canis]|uniref:Zinc finger protein n=1 Tax=Toxocara canis TaxID=6265 RepID=A0A0B2V2F0_TOXCA|nr:Zinc finger protein [Toxocara canis]